MARGLAAECTDVTVVVNVGDDDVMYGLHVSPDLDTVLYTLAGIEGPHGWGRSADTFTVMEQLGRLGVDNRFRIGDHDLATNLFRTIQLQSGIPLSQITADIAAALGVDAPVIPVTDDVVPTRIRSGSTWMSFQEYFVLRRAADQVDELEFANAAQACPVPDVMGALSRAEVVIIAPSNPPLSIWPILAIPGIREAVRGCRRVVAVSPLFGGRPLKGPAATVMKSLGLPAGNQGVADAYEGLITDLIVDVGDANESVGTNATVYALDTRIAEPARAAALARAILDLP